jgi:dihydroxyacid dehydratase/phosphogluconate dehydratase
MSLSEDLMAPTAMMYRNLLAIEVEETIRSQPLDGIVALGNCDKTVPAYLMALASADIPALLVTGGFRAPVTFRGERLGSGTSLWRYDDERRAGRLGDADWALLETCLGQGLGACNTMGTARPRAPRADRTAPRPDRAHRCRAAARRPARRGPSPWQRDPRRHKADR